MHMVLKGIVPEKIRNTGCGQKNLRIANILLFRICLFNLTKTVYKMCLIVFTQHVNHLLHIYQ